MSVEKPYDWFTIAQNRPFCRKSKRFAFPYRALSNDIASVVAHTMLSPVFQVSQFSHPWLESEREREREPTGTKVFEVIQGSGTYLIKSQSGGGADSRSDFSRFYIY